MNDKIKMFIADEEVVSNNDFTINEEMLSASSTILNNCYPKSWELTKDYVSNFYYPKDYSRFVLAQGEYLHGNQEFAPLEITGKNLFNLDVATIKPLNTGGTWAGNVYSFHNITMTFNSDNTITVNGTTNLADSYYLTPYFTLPAGTYSFTDNVAGENTNTYFTYLDGANKSSYDTNHSFTLSSDTSCRIRIVIRNAQTLNNVVFKIQLEKGSQATSFESYYQPNLSYETNVEKEINTFNIYGRTYQENNLAITNWEQGSGVDNNTQYRIRSKEIFRVRKGIVYKLTWSGTNASSYQMIINSSLDRTSYPFTTPIEVCGNSVSWSATSPIQFTATNDGYMGVIVSYKNGAPISPSDMSNLTITLENFMPSPDYPSELVSVGYQNIFTGKDSYSETVYGLDIAIKGTVLTINGSSTSSSQTNIQKAAFITPYAVKPNTVYTYKVFVLSGSVSGTRFAMNLRASATTSGTGIQFNTGNSLELIDGTSGATFTSASNANYLTGLQFIFSANASFNRLVLGIQLEEASKAHSYIPYGKYGIEVKAQGKNLCTQETNNIVIATLEAGTYTFSLLSSISGGYNLKKDNSSGTTIISGYISSSSSRQAVTFTINETTNIFVNGYSNTTGYTFANGTSDWQLEKGNQATTYEPYTSNTQLYVLDEPLRAVGTYKDKLYTDGRVLYVKREIGKVVLNGSEDGWAWADTRRYTVPVSNLGQLAGMSNYFRYFQYISHASTPTGTFDISQNKLTIGFVDKDISSLNNFKTWLSTHNTEVNYVLATPTITPLGYIDLPISYEGINYTTIYTGLDARTELWYYWKNYDVLFAGVVKNSGDISLNPRHPHYCSLQILDYKTFLSESDTLDFVISQKSIEEAIALVVNAVSSYGFVVGDINITQGSDIIGAYSTLNKTAYDVLQYLAEISGSRWRARVIDSLTMAIDFYDPDTLPEADDIEYTKQYWEDNNIVDMTFNYGSRDYRNKQILLSNEVYGNINYEETLISNGYGDTFTVQNNIGVLLTVIVDGAEKTIATINDKQMGIDADFYYTPGKNIIESNGVYSAGTMIRATYQPLVKGRQIVYNASEVERISDQTQTEGVIARYESRNDILSSEELQKIAQTYIDYKGKAEVIIKITTQDNDLYDIGEVVYFNAPIDDLKQNYMVKAKDIEYIIIDKIIHLFYVYELTSSFNSEKAINYFDNQRNKASGNIAEGESITRNIDIETEVGIIWTDGSVSSTTITVDGDNVLNSVLNSPFVE